MNDNEPTRVLSDRSERQAQLALEISNLDSAEEQRLAEEDMTDEPWPQ